MKFIIFALFFLFLSSCTGQAGGGDLSALKQEVLNTACDEESRRFYERLIEVQTGILTPEQMRNSLNNMKRNMRCQ